MDYKFDFSGFKGYICNPYLPANERLVNIVKESGQARCRTPKTREQALLRHLEQIQMTLDEYHLLEQEAKKQWIYNNAGYIVIPSLQIEAAMRAAANEAPASIRINQNWIGAIIRATDFVTPKKVCDTVFERMAKIRDPKGNLLSNQPRLVSNELITDFVADGQLIFDPADIGERGVLEFMLYTGKFVGVGSSRGLGYGRFKSVPGRPPKDDGKKRKKKEEEAAPTAGE